MTDTLTTTEAAAVLGKSARTVQRMVSAGRLHPVKEVGSRWLQFDRAEVERLAREQAREGER